MKKILAITALTAAASAAMAGPLQSGWSAVGTAGTNTTADGNISLAPGNKGYNWVSSANGIEGAGDLAGVDNSNARDGGRIESNVFSAQAGDVLSFYFNYITTDGVEFNDYAWAQLVGGTSGDVLLFTARTNQGGNTVPGFGMPTPAVTTVPAFVGINQGTDFSGLNGNSGSCFGQGCGHTGWVLATYTVVQAGDYFLRAGVTNWLDSSFDSALAIADVTINGVDIGDPNGVPAPGALALAGLGLLGLGLSRRKS